MVSAPTATAATYVWTAPTATADASFELSYEAPVVAVEEFRDVLEPYGTWTTYPEVGEVWVPDDPGYVPYRDGRWEYTEYGFTWISNVPFGSVVCHYGRWIHAGRWLWIPDGRWGPAWVTWGEAGTAIGWAPLPPDGWRHAIAATWWVFLQLSRLFDREPWPYYVPPSETYVLLHQARTIARPARPRRGHGWEMGPDERWLSRHGVPVRRTRPAAQILGLRGPSRTSSAARAPMPARWGAAAPARPSPARDLAPRPPVQRAQAARAEEIRRQHADAFAQRAAQIERDRENEQARRAAADRRQADVERQRFAEQSRRQAERQLQERQRNAQEQARRAAEVDRQRAFAQARRAAEVDRQRAVDLQRQRVEHENRREQYERQRSAQEARVRAERQERDRQQAQSREQAQRNAEEQRRRAIEQARLRSSDRSPRPSLGRSVGRRR